MLLGSYSGSFRIFKIGTPFQETDLIFGQNYPDPVVAVKVDNVTQSYMESEREKSVVVLFAKKLLVLNF